MGMVLGMVALSDENIQRLLDDPPLVWLVVAPDEPELYAAARAAQSKRGFLSKLFGGSASTVTVPDFEMSPPEGLTTDLDKAWHGIHYLLTKTAYEGQPPGNFVVSGGREVGDVEVGYGPARVLTSRETRDARDLLNSQDDDQLRGRFDPEDMVAKEIYPEIWTRDPQDETLGYLTEYVRILRGFLNQVTDSGLGIVQYLSRVTREEE